jgi:peptidoglycan/xylan/chitin deacetylase (PgdA/CDA1 family)
MEKEIFVTFLVVVLIILGARSNVYVALSFDVESDLPPVLNTSRGLREFNLLLDFLEREGVKATFFVTSDAALNYPELVFRMLKEGHEVGGHSARHSNLSALPYDKVLEDVSQNIFDITFFNTSVFSFRPPYNQFSTELASVLAALGVRVDASYKSSYPYFSDGLFHVTSEPLFYPSSVYPLDWVEVFGEALELQDDKLVKIVVVGLHSWELVELPFVEGYEEYTIPAGEYSWYNLKKLVRHAKFLRANFVTMKELHHLFDNS